MFFEGCSSCSLNLVFSVFFVFFITKKKTGSGTRSLCFSCFSEQKTVLENSKQTRYWLFEAISFI